MDAADGVVPKMFLKKSKNIPSYLSGAFWICSAGKCIEGQLSLIPVAVRCHVTLVKKRGGFKVLCAKPHMMSEPDPVQFQLRLNYCCSCAACATRLPVLQLAPAAAGAYKSDRLQQVNLVFAGKLLSNDLSTSLAVRATTASSGNNRSDKLALKKWHHENIDQLWACF